MGKTSEKIKPLFSLFSGCKFIIKIITLLSVDQKLDLCFIRRVSYIISLKFHIKSAYFITIYKTSFYGLYLGFSKSYSCLFAKFISHLKKEKKNIQRRVIFVIGASFF